MVHVYGHYIMPHNDEADRPAKEGAKMVRGTQVAVEAAITRTLVKQTEGKSHEGHRI